MSADGAAPAPAPPVRGRGALLAALALAACVVGIFSGVVFRGESLVFSNNYNPLDYRHVAEAYGPHFFPAEVWMERNLLAFANFHDPGATWWQWEPAGEFLRQGFRKGEWPLWDPYVAAGAPALANPAATAFFPPYLLLVLAGNTVLLKNVYFLALLLVSGFCTERFLRGHGLAPVASLFGALAFMFCGGIVQSLGSFIGQTAMCIPVALELTRRFLARPTWRWTGSLALGWAALALSAFPPLLLACFGLTVFYALCVLAMAPPAAPRPAVVACRLALAAGLALALAAFQYVPVFAAMRSTPHVAAFYDHEGLLAARAVSFLQLFSPTLMGGDKVFADPPMKMPAFPPLPYAGVIPCLLALLGIRRGARGREPLRIATVAAFVLISWKILGLAPVQWIAYLPLLRTIHFAVYWGIALDFLIAVAAALGLQAIVEGRVRWRHALSAVAVLVGVAVTIRWWAVAAGALAHPRAEDWEEAWAFFVTLAAVGALGVLAAALWRARPAVRQAIAALVTLALLVEAWGNTTYPRQRRWDVWRNPVPYVQTLVREAGVGRVFTSGVLPANASSAFAIFGLDSLMTFNPPRIFTLYKTYIADGVLFLREARQLPSEGILDRANIELVAIRTQFEAMTGAAASRGWERRHQDDYATIFRRPSTPRYFFSSAFRVVHPDAALTAVGEMPPGRELLLESPPSFPSQPNDATDPAVTIVAFERNAVRLAVDAPRAGMVYCAESFFPGWTARVNGAEAAIAPANYAFRAVEVPAGRSVVELAYWPPGLTAGLVLSALGAVAVALMMRRRDGDG